LHGQKNHINVPISVEIQVFVGYRNCVSAPCDDSVTYGGRAMGIHNEIVAHSMKRRSFLGGSDAWIIMGR
jgi:hypothetical protein